MGWRVWWSMTRAVSALADDKAIAEQESTVNTSNINFGVDHLWKARQHSLSSYKPFQTSIGL